MIVPVSKESFDFIAKSSNNIIEFIKGLKKDDKVKSAIRSIPNMDSYLEGGDVEPILVAMTAQDIIRDCRLILSVVDAKRSSWHLMLRATSFNCFLLV